LQPALVTQIAEDFGEYTVAEDELEVQAIAYTVSVGE
jgi:hypothetical protein